MIVGGPVTSKPGQASYNSPRSLAIHENPGFLKKPGLWPSIGRIVSYKGIASYGQLAGQLTITGKTPNFGVCPEGLKRSGLTHLHYG